MALRIAEVGPGCWPFSDSEAGILRMRPNGEGLESYARGMRNPYDFVTGLWSPVDVVNAPDGSVVIADYLTGRLFKVSWAGQP